MTRQLIVSIIIPCRNERKFIGGCLDSIIANDYPKDKLEVLVVDGMSEDGSREIVHDYTRRYPFIRLLDNPKRIIPAAFNAGIGHSTGKIIIIMSGHSTYNNNYITTCVKSLAEYGADNVGGVLTTVPGVDTAIAKSIALSLSHPFGAGNSYLRIGSSKPRWADTTGFGCYKREVFDRIGLYNEDLTRSSDMDLNVRLRAAGGKILLNPDIVAHYRADPTLRAFFKHNFVDGLWAVYPLKFGSRTFYWRHLGPLAFVLGLAGSAVASLFFATLWWLFLGIFGAYILVNTTSSLQIAVKERHLGYMATLPLAFVTRHIAYGLGSFYGMIKVLGSSKTWKNRFAIARHSS